MAKSNRSSSTPASSTRPAKPGNKRGGNQYGIGGTLVTLLLVILYWWLNGGLPAGDSSTSGVDVDAPGAITLSPTVDRVIAESVVLTTTAVAVAEAEQAAAPEAAVTATSTIAPPTATSAPAATATLLPTPPATKLPKPTSSPTSVARAGPRGMPVLTLDELPPEALDTLDLIRQDGPFPFDRDGITFQNRERLLPQKPRGYYREYTVITPGERDRGARRIVTGENGELYYTDDHYDSFSWIVEE